MPDFCAAFGCSNERNEKTKKQGITFHRFPNDKLRRNAWKAAVRRKEFEPTHRTVLCSFHFKPEDFDRTGQTVRIKEGVIPSIFKFPDRLSKLPRSTSSSRTSNKAATECPGPGSGRPTDRGLGELDLSERSISLPSTSRSHRTSKATEFPPPQSCTPVRGLSEVSISLYSTSRSSRTSKAEFLPPQSCTPVRGLRPIDLSEESISDHDYALDPAKAKQKLAEYQKEVEKLRRQLRNARDRERRHKKTVNSLLKVLKGKNILTKELLKNLRTSYQRKV
ncbi:THAP domain-containing protein 3-like [Alosa alosa]|uniref:THAP domain-containing protein 3-like n=1 Tax=Alosa alosa TaxID=278164 RepID=UPI0020154A8F|nr:THAP domain-containing protein 3-like [Alosa alosa]